MSNGPETIEVLVPVDEDGGKPLSDADEETIIEALNFKGNACDLATKDVERAFVVSSKKHKPEYNAKGNVKRNVKLGN